MKLLPWLRLLRLPNLPSAITNVLAGASFGVFLGGAWDFPKLIAACVGSLCVYAAGLVFNDFADLEEDRLYRFERPLPSGQISEQAALRLGVSLLVIAAIASFWMSDRGYWILSSVAILAMSYDFWLKRWAVSGPVTLGLCRAGNWSLGLYSVALPTDFSIFSVENPALWIFLLYFFYIAGLSVLARQEEKGFGSWKPETIQRWVGTLLGGIYLLDLALAIPGMGFWALSFLIPWFLARWLRRKISPT